MEKQPRDISYFDELLSEAQVCERFPLLVSSQELRRARRRGEITYIAGKKGQCFYHPDELAAYLKRKERPLASTIPPLPAVPQPRKQIRQDWQEEGDRIAEELRLERILQKRPRVTNTRAPAISRSLRQTPQAMVDEAEKILHAQLREKYSRKRPKHTPKKGKLDDSVD